MHRGRLIPTSEETIAAGSGIPVPSYHLVLVVTMGMARHSDSVDDLAAAGVDIPRWPMQDEASGVGPFPDTGQANIPFECGYQNDLAFFGQRFMSDGQCRCRHPVVSRQDLRDA